MSNNKKIFEKEIKHKLSIKTNNNQSEENLLLKTFKYFDLSGDNEIELEDFIKAMAKVGISGFDDNYIKEMFYSYANKTTNTINYKKFVKDLFHGVTNKYEQLTPILEKLNTKFHNIGFLNTINLLKVFYVKSNALEDLTDKNNNDTICNKGISPKNFEEINIKYNLDLKTDEIEKIFFSFYELNTVNYKALFSAIIGNLSPERQKIVEECLKLIINSYSNFSKNYTEDENELLIDYLFEMYHPESCELLINKYNSSEEALEEFKNTYEIVNDVYSIVSPDNNLNPNIFIQYYSFVSFFTPNENEFRQLIQDAFEVNKLNEKKKKAVNKTKKLDNSIESDNTIEVKLNKNSRKTLENLKSKLIKLDKLFFVKLNNQFISMDIKKNKTLTFDCFEKAIKATKVNIIKNEINYIFKLFESTADGMINYERFLKTIINSNDRVKSISNVFTVLEDQSLKKKNELFLNFILNKFDATNHPEVQNGNKEEIEVYEEFKDAIESNFIGVMPINAADVEINKNDFILFYLCFSVNVSNDKLFDVIINNTWKLSKEIYEYKPNIITNENEDIKPVKKERLVNEYEKKHHTNYTTPYGTETASTNKYLFDVDSNKKIIKISNELKSLKILLRKRGTRGIMSLRRNFELADIDKNGKIDFKEFKYLIKDKLRLNIYDYINNNSVNDSLSSSKLTSLPNNKATNKNKLSNKEDEIIRKLFNEFDKDKSNDIDFNEFITSILGDLSLERQTRLKQVFYNLDKDNSGNISQDELKDGFYYKRHPDVLHGKRTSDEIYAEFIDNIEYHFNLIRGEDPNRALDLDEFIEFYKNISFIYESNSEFLDYLKCVWNLDA